MNFLKSITAAALLATAISSGTMAADQFGFEGNAGAQTFTLTPAIVNGIKDGSLLTTAGADDDNKKEVGFATAVYRGLLKLADAGAIDAAFAKTIKAGGVAVNLIDTFSTAADWDDGSVQAILATEVEKTVTTVSNFLGLKDADVAAGEVLAASRPSLMVKLQSATDYVKLSDVADVNTLKGAVVKKDTGAGDGTTVEMPLKDYYAAQLGKLGSNEHSALAQVMAQKEKHEETRGRLEAAQQDITDLTGLLTAVRIDTSDKKTIQAGLAKLVEDLRVATEEARKPKKTPEETAKIAAYDEFVKGVAKVPLKGVDRANGAAVMKAILTQAATVGMKDSRIQQLEAQLAGRIPTPTAPGSNPLATPSLSTGLSTILGGTSGGSRTEDAARRSRPAPDASLAAPSLGGTLTATAPRASLSRIEQGVVSALSAEQQELYHAHRAANKPHTDALAAARAGTRV